MKPQSSRCACCWRSSARADRIAPEAVEIYSDYLTVNSAYHRTLFVYDLPDTVHIGFLARLTEMKDRIKVVKYIRPVPKKDALAILGRKKAQLIAAEHTTSQGNVLVRERMRMARESVEHAHREVQSDRERYHELSILVHIEAESLQKLDSLTERVKTKLDEMHATTKTAREEMWEGYVSCLPFGENHLVKRYCTSGILTNPLSCFSTFSSLQLSHSRGVLWGTDQSTDAAVIYDDKKVPNRHKIILGGSGMGKTVLVKALSTRCRLRGETNILIDPEGRTRYESVAKRLGGQFVKLGQGSSTRINPLDLPSDYPDLQKLGDSIAEEESPEEALYRAREGAYNSKLTTIVSLLGVMANASESATDKLSTRLQGKLEKVLAETYADKGISEDPDTHHRTPPVMADFFAKLAHYTEGERADHDLVNLRASLYPWEKGSLRKIFDGRTNVNLRSKYLVFRISAGENGPEKAPLMFVLLDFLRGRLADPRESITCWIDEMWSLLYYPMAVSLLNNFWRAFRASNTAMVGITQDLEEFLGSEQSATLMRQSQTYALLGQSKSTVEKIAGYTELAEETRKEISNYAEGEALLIAGRRQLPIKVSISAEEERLYNTDPDKDEHYLESSLAEDGRDGLPALSGAPESDRAPAPSLGELAPYANGRPAGRIYVLSGESAPEVAFSLAGLFAGAATRHATGGRVLLVDASGSISDGLLAGMQRRPTDELLGSENANANGGGRRSLDDYLVLEPESGLKVLLRPSRDSSEAGKLAERLASEFDAVVVACASTPSPNGTRRHWPRYAEDWVLSASKIVTTAETSEGLSEGISDLEEIGELNQRPLLALTGPDDDGANLPARAVVALPDGERLRRAMAAGEFASLQDESATESFARLAHGLSQS